MSFILLGILNSQVEAAGGAAYELIESNILTGSASSVTFSSIPQDYKHLQIRAVFKSDSLFGIRFNSDSGSNYASHRLSGDGSSVTSGYNSLTYGWVGRNESLTNAFATNLIDILDYQNTSKNTTVRALGGTVGTFNWIELRSSAWLNTSTVSSIDLLSASGNLAIGSRFSLYGLRGE